MHELSITESILDVVLKHAADNQVRRVVSVTLHVGELGDIENEWMQYYFDYLSKDTIAEGARLKIKRVPIRLRCGTCNFEFEVSKEAIAEVCCPICKAEQNFSYLSGREYFIKEMEVE